MTEPQKPPKESASRTTDVRLGLEREWLAAAAERDALRDAIKVARQSGDAAALAAVKLRRKEATNHCNEIMSRYQQAAGVAPLTPPPKPPKPVAPPDTRRPDMAREIEAELADLIGRADAAGLTVVAGTLIAARDAARRVIERGGTGEKAG